MIWRSGLVVLIILAGIMPGCIANEDSSGISDANNHLENNKNKISAVDISYYPQISKFNHTYLDRNGEEVDFIDSLIENGVNTIRLRIWNNPPDNSSSFAQVLEFSNFLKSKGLRIWLCPHYSDTWADPGQQKTPVNWDSLDYEELKIEVYEYTKYIVTEIDPDFIQIGNEVNNGMLFPHGNIHHNTTQFLEILKRGSDGVRDSSDKAKIILHFAGLESSISFFDEVKLIDYDVAGISYYPLWHGKSIENVGDVLEKLANSTGKEVLVAETAYPFTLDWNDWTDNILGSESQLILPEYPAAPEGQRDFLHDLKKQIFDVDGGIGFCYWGADMISWAGQEAKNGSVWENQAIYNFENKELPILMEFNLSHH
ncbi:MAG: arabinogalactan endo-1,4-beta-galactosidase [Euryarchaeota archaeon]|nr:arabinogalactan endo-1,4-beta-galactosidase [Euryarchaeota archaeon]